MQLYTTTIRNNSRVPQRHRKTAAGSVGWSSWSIRKNLHCWQCPGHPQWLVHGPVSCRLVRFLVALCHNLHNCTAAVQERERNCSRISRNWRQLRVCKSVPPPVVRPWVQDVNFCDAKIERLFLSRKKERCLNDCPALLHPDTVKLSRA